MRPESKERLRNYIHLTHSPRSLLLILKWTVSKLSSRTPWKLVAGVKARGLWASPWLQLDHFPAPPICFYPKTSRKQKFSLLEKHFSGELRSVFSFPDFNPFVYLSTFTPPESNTLIQFHCTKVFPPLKAYPWRTYHNEYFLDILNTCTSITVNLETPMHGNPVFFADTSCPHPKGRGLNSM